MFDLGSRLSDFTIGSPEYLELMNLEISLEEAEEQAKLEEEAGLAEYEDQRSIADAEWVANDRAFTLQGSEDDIFLGKRVLMIEGNRTNYSALSVLIKHTGVMLDFASNVSEAFDKYSNHYDGFDMILLGADMPDIDVYDAELSYFGEVPIITMTDLHEPIDAEEVIAKMREYLT